MHARYTALLSKQVITEAVKQVKEEKQGRQNTKREILCNRNNECKQRDVITSPSS